MKIHLSKPPKKNFFWILFFWGPKLSFIFSLLSLIFTTLHCSNKVGKNDKEKKVLVVAMEDAPSTLYPPLARSAYSFRAVELIHKGLFKFDENLNPIPDLAEEVKIENLDEEKKRKVVLTIKIKDAKTCSGEKISGELVKNSLEEYKRWGKFDYIEKIEAENDKIKLTLSRPYSSVFYDLAVPIFPKNFTDCTGLFKVKKFIPENITELESQDGKLKVIIKGVKNDITRVLEFEKGDIDIIVNAIPPHLIDYVKSLKNVHLLLSPGINITYIAFNLKNDTLKNKNVRLAIAHAIPKEEIIENILQNQAEPIFSFIPKRSEFYFEDKKIEYNPKLAEKLLDESGFKKNENGIRFELTWKTSTVKYAIRNVKAIASYLEKIGIKINIAQREFSTLIYEINKGNFDLFSLNLVGVKDPQILKDIAHTKKTPPYGLNRVFFSNPAFDEIVEKIEEEIDKEKRKEFVKLAQKIIQEELPYLPLWQVKDIIAIRGDKMPQEKISKIKITPGGSLLFLSYLLQNKTYPENQSETKGEDERNRDLLNHNNKTPSENNKIYLEEFPDGGKLKLRFTNPVFFTENPIHKGIFYVVEQPGTVKYIYEGKVGIFLDIKDRVDFGGEKGLLGLAFSPEFEKNGRVYVSYVDKFGNSVISYFISEDRKFKVDHKKEFIVIKVKQPPFPNHKGGMIAFGEDKMLYISLGDGGGAGDPFDNSQNTKNLLGKILRIDPEPKTKLPNNITYLIPKDNPFYGDVVCGIEKNKKPKSGCAEIFAWGLRNPWRFSFDRKTGIIWAGDVGQDSWEEINIIQKGKNYGWRCFEGFEPFNLKKCKKENYLDEYQFPITVYPISKVQDCSVIGGYVYRGSKIKSLYGKYIFGDWCSGKIRVLDADKLYQDYKNELLSDNQKKNIVFQNVKTETLIDTDFMISSFGEDNEGEIYVLDHKGGKIYKIKD